MGRSKKAHAAAVLLAAVVLPAAVFGPEQLALYQDRFSLNQITEEKEDSSSKGYRYTLDSNEKLFLLSRCLRRQVLPESEQSSMARVQVPDMDYNDLMGNYAFIVNRQGPSEKELTEEEVFMACRREMDVLKELGILEESVKEVAEDAYEATFYEAIDVRKPQNSMAVWKLCLSDTRQNVDKANRLIEACIDAGSGRIYSFYVRTEADWADMDTEGMMEKWSGYLGLEGMEACDAANPLLETASYYQKYRFPGIEDGSTVVTIGFYEGIKEFFIKII